MPQTKPSVKLQLGKPYDMNAPINSEFASILANKIHAGFQLIGISTREEDRVERSIYNICNAINTPVIMWDIADGFTQPSVQATPPGPGGRPAPDPSNFKLLNASTPTPDPLHALRSCGPDGPINASLKLGEDQFPNKQLVFIFRDFQPFLEEDPVVRRCLRSMYTSKAFSCGDYFRPIIFISPDLSFPAEVRDCVTRVKFPLPDTNELNNTVEMVYAGTKANQPDLAPIPGDLRAGLLSDMRGMSAAEAENALAEAVVHQGGFKDEMRVVLKRSKADAVEQSGALTYVDPSKLPKPEDIGGFEVAKTYVRRRALAYSSEAEAMNLDYPKGIAMVGVPGSGKTEFAKMVASQTGLPLYLLDVSAIFKSHIGESEATMRLVKEIVTAQHGCVLVCNEIDKAFSHAHDSQGDSGVTARVFGQLLDWRSDNRDRTFMVYTMNRVNTLPPELLRKGRVDKIFSADLPNPAIRRKIFEIHMNRRGVSFESAGLTESHVDAIVASMDNLTGSEIEEVVIEAMFNAYEAAEKKHKVPNNLMFIESVAETKRDSMMVVDPESVASIRTWCKTRAVPVDAPEEEPVTPPITKSGRGKRGIKTQPSSN